MHMVTCKIILGGDNGQIVHRQEANPVSWPEVGVIQYTHGEESVFDIEVCGEVEATRAGEKARLAEIYGKSVLEAVYPGRAPVLEMEMPGSDEKKPTPKDKVTATAPVQPDVSK